ncbi:MAG: hypothetical protein IKO94_09715, partial [Selenomonadaceae bacterium]|nr:hypothetical protein [Selenomonadaceae bacterium]
NKPKRHTYDLINQTHKHRPCHRRIGQEEELYGILFENEIKGMDKNGARRFEIAVPLSLVPVGRGWELCYTVGNQSRRLF